jgi:hypothetical protein
VTSQAARRRYDSPRRRDQAEATRAAIAGAARRLFMERGWAGTRVRDGNPAGQLTAMIGFDRRLVERGGDVLGVLHDAGRSEPDLATAYREGRARADRLRQRVLATWPPGAFREGMDHQLAADTYAALCNIDVYRVLAEERGWSPARIERWWRDCLIRLILG